MVHYRISVKKHAYANMVIEPDMSVEMATMFAPPSDKSASSRTIEYYLQSDFQSRFEDK